MSPQGINHLGAIMSDSLRQHQHLTSGEYHQDCNGLVRIEEDHQTVHFLIKISYYRGRQQFGPSGSNMNYEAALQRV